MLVGDYRRRGPAAATSTNVVVVVFSHRRRVSHHHLHHRRRHAVVVAAAAEADDGGGGGGGGGGGARSVVGGGFGAGVATQSTADTNPLDDHVDVDRFYDGLRQVHSSPDVYLVDDFLTPDECDSIVAAARTRDMDQSPVVYAGWTNDVGDIVNNAARGPALWAAALAMLSAASSDGPGPGILLRGVGVYAAVVAVAGAGAGVGEVSRGTASVHANEHVLRVERRQRRGEGVRESRGGTDAGM